MALPNQICGAAFSHLWERVAEGRVRAERSEGKTFRLKLPFMKAVLQRVSSASVEVGDEIVSQIEVGFCVFVTVSSDDTEENARKMAGKIAGMRVFSDAEGKFNLDLKDVGGSVLLVSNFTLFGDARKGNRPYFGAAARPELAQELFELLATLLRSHGLEVRTGVFGADMKVSLRNEGPVTLTLEF